MPIVTPEIPSPRQAGFSLVETALAVGIVAFAFVGLFALLPVGLSNFSIAVDDSVGAQIFQRVVSDVEQMEFDTLLSAGSGANGEFYPLPIRYFDDQGNEVRAEDSIRIIYHARIRVAKPGPANPQAAQTNFTSLPAAPGQTRFSPRNSVFLTIQIAHNPGNRNLPIDLATNLWTILPARQQSLPIATYSAIVTRNGYSKR
ncbi:MAG: hypothetical protein QOE70_2345 [Chthoniobacter sp.]|jgi:uncharacterized protein (TIGR02598 family)|nr:hypothetical protein [Chthoniobacter sp.]